MGWLEFFAALAGSFAWPTVVVIALFVFRHTVHAAMGSLTSKASGHIHYRDFQMGWNSQLAAAEAEVERAEAQTDPAGRPEIEPVPPGPRSANEEFVEALQLHTAMLSDLQRALRHRGLESPRTWSLAESSRRALAADIITPEMHGAVTNCAHLLDLLMLKLAEGDTRPDDVARYVHDVLLPLRKMQVVIAGVVSQMLIPAAR